MIYVLRDLKDQGITMAVSYHTRDNIRNFYVRYDCDMLPIKRQNTSTIAMTTLVSHMGTLSLFYLGF